MNEFEKFLVFMKEFEMILDEAVKRGYLTEDELNRELGNKIPSKALTDYTWKLSEMAFLEELERRQMN